LLDDASPMCSFLFVWPFTPQSRPTRARRKLLRSAFLTALIGRIALAQPAPTPEEVQQAQSRWKEGKAFFDAGNFEAARVAFRQAYTIFPHPAFLQNLGEAELRSSRYVDAARHLAQYLHLSTSGSPAQRDGAKSSLKKAAEKLAAVVIEANVEDAEIRVDDELVGRTPLGALAWYVEPGRHLVVARKVGYLDGSEPVELGAGSTKNVYVRLSRLVETAASPAPKSDDRSIAKASLASTALVPSGPLPRESSASEARTVVLLSGTILTVAASTIGAYYALRIGADSNKLATEKAQLQGSSATACGSNSMMEPNKTICGSIVTTSSQLQTDKTIRNVSFAVAGALGIATVATFFLWPSRGRSTAIVPQISERFAGVAVQGAL
jgi:hypothetical protein